MCVHLQIGSFCHSLFYNQQIKRKVRGGCWREEDAKRIQEEEGELETKEKDRGFKEKEKLESANEQHYQPPEKENRIKKH